ncbi:DUF3389 family protein [Vibrio hippocampi]|uniref:PTS sugar transporter subunit IIA n=1 Tax=Vibrio hippocampi TaxID=654686 RepID=A0ABN8DJQ9_9VIBR|nr:DUF3389 family protein [Vibrio hippocampi]CAH0529581.1 hypothetical protein VHP8226_03336 [Vibrio hippocampi]
MMMEFSQGKVIVAGQEIVVRLNQASVTLQAHIDGVQLLLPGCVLLANGAECKWSLKLDNQQQVEQIAQATGIEIITV